MTYMLEAIGLHVGHEMDERHCWDVHGVPANYDGYCSGVFYKNMGWPKVDLILHMTRHPIAVISSCRKIQGRIGWNTIKYWRPDLVKTLPKSLLYRMMLSWLVFTEAADKHATYHFQVENVHTEYKKLCGMIGVKPRKVPSMVPKVHVSKPYQYSLDELYVADEHLARRIEDKAVQYGYDVRSKP
jgi:hypothetical protein